MTRILNTVYTRAPGKLFLLGEYAVLYGAPAVLMAVDRYVNVTLDPAANAWLATFTGGDAAPLNGVWQSGSLVWSDAQPEHALLVTIMEVLVEAQILGAEVAPFALHIDSTALFDKGQKLGLGSSAAVCNAVIRAVLAHVPFSGDESSIHRLIFAVHRRFQNGQGSGADIAAGICGGTFEYRTTADPLKPHIKSLKLPPGLFTSAIWTGRAASTSRALTVIENFRKHHASEFSDALAPLTAAAIAGVAAVRCQDVSRFAEICRAYCHNLSDFGRIVGLDVVSEAHREVLTVAGRWGVAYKPSGAGDGDFGIAISSNIKQLEGFEREVAGAGYRCYHFGQGQECHLA